MNEITFFLSQSHCALIQYFPGDVQETVRQNKGRRKKFLFARQQEMQVLQ